MVLAFVLGLHVIFGVGLIVGTAMKIIAKQRETIVAVDVKEDKQQEVKEPPPPPPDYVPPPVAPPPTTDVPVIRGPPSETAIAAPKVQAPPPPKAEEKPAPPPVVPVKFTKDGASLLASTCSDMYPSASRRLSEEGSVTLEVFVGADGKVSDAKVVTSSGFPRLDEANVKCVKGIKAFVPQTVGGQNIGSWQVMKYRWKLN